MVVNMDIPIDEDKHDGFISVDTVFKGEFDTFYDDYVEKNFVDGDHDQSTIITDLTLDYGEG